MRVIEKFLKGKFDKEVFIKAYSFLLLYDRIKQIKS